MWQEGGWTATGGAGRAVRRESHCPGCCRAGLRLARAKACRAPGTFGGSSEPSPATARVHEQAEWARGGSGQGLARSPRRWAQMKAGGRFRHWCSGTNANRWVQKQGVRDEPGRRERPQKQHSGDSEGGQWGGTAYTGPCGPH